MSPATSPRIPDLELLKVIGSGSYGEVWLARTMTGIYRAVKIVDRFRFRDERPWLREFAGISRFQKSMEGHKRQMALLHVGQAEEQGFFYYVMELADDVHRGSDIDPESYLAATLKSVREHRPAMSLPEILRLGEDLARALGDLHSAGLIHRDVKPSNIVFVQGTPKLADLGLVASSEFTLTSLGTPGYTPPEGVGSRQGDIYSLGKILYELAMGLPSTEFPRLPTERLQSADANRLMELNEVLLKACHPNPDQRYPDTDKLLADLLLIQAGGSVVDLARLRERLRYARQLAAALGGLALLVGGVLGVKNYQATRRLAQEEAAARILAEKEARLSRYTANLQLAQMGADANDFGAVRQALQREVPALEQADLRGAEWWSIWNGLQSDALRHWTPSNAHQLQIQSGPRGSNLLVWLCLGQPTSAGTLNTRTNALKPLAGELADLGQPDAQGLFLVSDRARLLSDVDLASGAATPWGSSRGAYLASNAKLVLTGRMETDRFVLMLHDRASKAELSQWISPSSTPAPGLSDADLSADSRYFALTMFTGEAKRTSHLIIHDIAANRDIKTISADWVMQKVSISPDGRRVAAGGTAWLGVWDTATGAMLWRTDLHEGNTSALAWSPDSTLLAAGGSAQATSIWNAGNGERLHLLFGSESTITGLQWNEAGDRLYASNENGVILEFPWPTPSIGRRSLPDLNRGVQTNCLFSDDESGILYSDTNQSLQLRRIKGQELQEACAWSGAAIPLCAKPGGNDWFAFNEKYELVLCRAGQGRLKSERVGSQIDAPVRITETKLSPNHQLLALGQEDGLVRVFSFPDLKEKARFSQLKGIIHTFAFSADNQSLYVGDTKHLVIRLNLSQPDKAPTQVMLDERTERLCLSPNGRLLAVGLANGNVLILDPETLAIRHTLAAHRGKAYAVLFTQDNSRLITGGLDGNMEFYQTDDWRLVYACSPLPSPNGKGKVGIYNIEQSPGGNELAVLGMNGENVLINIARGQGLHAQPQK